MLCLYEILPAAKPQIAVKRLNNQAIALYYLVTASFLALVASLTPSVEMVARYT